MEEGHNIVFDFKCNRADFVNPSDVNTKSKG